VIIVYPANTSERRYLMKVLRARKAVPIKDGTLVVAVSIGMVSNHTCCTTVDGKSTKTLKFDDTREGLNRLWGMMLAGKAGFQCNEVITGYESTGPCGRLIHCLKQKPAKIVTSKPATHEKDE
jgi:hypothetical protein